MIDKLKKEIKEIDDKISLLRKEKEKKKLALNELEFGIKIGDIVEYQSRKYKISHFEYSWPSGYAIKNNGEFGKQTRHLYNYKKVGE